MEYTRIESITDQLIAAQSDMISFLKTQLDRANLMIKYKENEIELLLEEISQLRGEP